MQIFKTVNLGKGSRGVNGFQSECPRPQQAPHLHLPPFALNRPRRPGTVRALMNKAAAAVLLLAGLLTASADAGFGRLERTRLSGADYIRLADWADLYHFHPAWARPREEMQLTNAASRLLFTVDSHRAEIDGVAVHLNSPAALRGTSLLVSSLDLDSVVRPVLFPPKNAARVPLMSVCLDPGHGGKDPGNEEGRRREKDFTLQLARALGEVLGEAGLQVVLTRSGDTFVPLPDRTETARRRDADLFVSLHFNAALSEKDQVHGVEVYCLTPAGAESTNARGESDDTAACAGNRFDEKNMLLAFQIQKALVRELPVEDRGVKHARFAVLRNARIPAVLVEAGFMSHPQESRRIFDAQYRRELARAIAHGILSYKRLVER